MTALELKSDLHILIEKVNDVNLLNKIRIVLSKQVNDSDFWDELPEKIKKSIEISLKQADSSESVPHETVMSEFREKYGLS
jgi:hypothetical protein